MTREEVIELLNELRDAADYLPTDKKYLDALECAVMYIEENKVYECLLQERTQKEGKK